jgi:hypothetical protein
VRSDSRQESDSLLITIMKLARQPTPSALEKLTADGSWIENRGQSVFNDSSTRVARIIVRQYKRRKKKEEEKRHDDFISSPENFTCNESLKLGAPVLGSQITQ